MSSQVIEENQAITNVSADDPRANISAGWKFAFSGVVMMMLGWLCFCDVFYCSAFIRCDIRRVHVSTVLVVGWRYFGVDYISRENGCDALCMWEVCAR